MFDLIVLIPSNQAISLPAKILLLKEVFAKINLVIMPDFSVGENVWVFIVKSKSLTCNNLHYRDTKLLFMKL